MGPLTPPVGQDSLLSPLWSGTPVSSLASDEAVLAGFFHTEIAWLVGLGANGIDTAPTLRALRDVTEGHVSVAQLAATSWQAGNPVVGFVATVRKELAKRGSDSEVFHAGLTSQDVLDTALMVVAKGVLTQVLGDLDRVGDRLAVLAKKHSDSPCLATTLSRDAEVTLWGVRLSQWLDMVTDSHRVLSRAKDELRVQRGGAVGNGRGLAQVLIERAGHQDLPERMVGVYQRFAKELGLVDPGNSWHSHRGPVLDVVGALSHAGVAMATIARNIVHLGRPEIAEVALKVPPGVGGSSAMPHKVNPVQPILVFSGSYMILGLVAQVTAAATTIDERSDGAWNAEWQAFRELMRVVGGQSHHLAAVLETLEIDDEAAASRLAASSVPEALLPDALRVTAPATIDGSITTWQGRRQ
jgi:3-carboxy-cis,cis-muconate cycloisomerase